MIANGNFRTALESAKQLHKAQATSASERLLIDAYAARIQSLVDQNLTLEAKSLLSLVQERFPSAKERLDVLRMATSASGGDLAALLSPLNEPELSRERRSAIEQAVQSQVADLKALADCPALLPEHPLRKAAAALARAFTAVTTGPVTMEQIALPEVSHRSPLASWKLLIHAIACFHRGDDETSLNHLAAILPDSVPSRLVRAMRAMLGKVALEAKESEARKSQGAAAVLKSPELSLIARTTLNLRELRRALVDLDRAFDEDENTGRIYRAVRTAVRECQRSLPDRLTKLKQLITVRAGVEYMDTDHLTAALEGAPRPDAVFFRMYARAMETTGEPDDLAEACELWKEFGAQAVREAWFRSSGVEAAVLCLHMADVLRRIPDFVLSDLQASYILSHERSKAGNAAADDRYFLFPEELYRRACAMDSHPESFSQWMTWAAGRSDREAESVALEWNKARPGDIQPVLHLMLGAEKRSAIPTALSYLAVAERIDGVHSSVRAARLRLLAAGAIRHLQQKRPHLAKEKLAAIAILPQSRQGDRPAILSTLSHLIAVAERDLAAIAETRLEVERLVGGRIAAGLLIFGIGAASKCLDYEDLPLLNELDDGERKTIPASMSRVMAIADDVGIRKFKLPSVYIDEAAKQFPAVCDSLNSGQIRLMGELGIAAEHPRLAWRASQIGIEQGGPAEAHFLLLRARAIPPQFALRTLVVAAAAAELGRLYRNVEVVGRAVEIVRNPTGRDSLSLTLDQAREVLREEIASSAFPTDLNPGPDYRHLLPGPPRGGADYRRQREDFAASLDEDDDENDPYDFDTSSGDRLPEEMPPDIAEEFFKALKGAFRAGETPEDVITRVLGNASGRRTSGKNTSGKNTSGKNTSGKNTSVENKGRRHK